MNALYRVSDSHLIDPPDYGPEPGLDHYSEALDRLVADSDRLSTFCMDEQPDYTTVFQLYHAHGLPKRDGSKRDDELCEKYDAAFNGLLVHYRDWLDETLTDEANKVMEEEAERARQDADEARADAWMDY